MSKKNICVCLILALVLALLAGCNRTVLDTKWKFKSATVVLGDSVRTYEVAKWTDFENSDMIQFTDTDGVVHMTHSSNVILEG